MLKIRLMRIGAKKRPFYRVVAVDERAKRTGAYVELLGTYNPLTEPKEIKLNQERIDYWVKQGAQPSDGFLRIIGKAKQRPPRKPKKAASVKDSDEPMEKKEAPAEEARGDGEEGSTIEPAGNEVREDAPGSFSENGSPVDSQTEPAGPRAEEEPVTEVEEKTDERPT